MFSIVITEKGGAQRQLEIESGEVSIGRLDDNDICLPKSNVSKHHARLVFKDERYVLLDQQSTNGTYVNGRRISAPMVVRKGDKIYIGDFILTLAAPGGRFEGVSEREYRPRRGGSPEQSPREDLPGGAAPPPRKTIDQRPSAASAPEGGRSQRKASPPSPPVAAGKAPSSPPPPPPPNTDRSAGIASSVAAAAAASVAQSSAAARATAPAPPPRAASTPPPLPSSSNRAGARTDAALERISNRVPSDVTIVGDPVAVEEPANDAQPEASQLSGLTSPAVLAPSVRLQAALAMLMERLATEMNVARPEESAFPSEHAATLERLLDELTKDGALGPDLDRRFLRDAAISEAVGLGPLDRLLANRAVREIVVDGPTRILADLGGGLSAVSSFFSDDSAVMVAARRLLHRAGRKFDDSAPVQEARLPAGGLVQLLLPPLSAKGPLVTVRCPPRTLGPPEGLITEGMLSSEMLALLRASVQQRRTILVLGSMSSGVSTLLANLVSLTADHERIVTIEKTPSASLLHARTLPLQRSARPDLSLDHFLQLAARLRYDRLVIDDVSGSDALAALTAAAVNPGLLLGMHAPSPETALLQLELFAQAALGGGHTSLAPLLSSALSLLVHVATTPEGNRHVTSISELSASADNVLHLTELFRHDAASGFVKVA